MSNENRFLITYGLQHFVTFTPGDGKNIFTIHDRESQEMIRHAMTLISENIGTSVDIQVSWSQIITNGSKLMARKNAKNTGPKFMVFNVTYDDGTLTSNRRVSKEYLDQSLGDNLLDLARTAIQEQDNEIARRSNQRRANIKSIAQIVAWLLYVRYGSEADVKTAPH